MRRRRVAAGCACLALAVVGVLCAHDVWAWRTALRGGDLRAGAAPVSERTWSAATILPAGVASGLLGIDGDVAYRRLLTRAEAALAGQPTEDKSRTQVPVEVALTQLERSRDRVRAATAANLLGVLAYASPDEPGQASAERRAVEQFRRALRLDPGDADAKWNLELMLRVERARPSRGSGTRTGGDTPGSSGVGLAARGSGY